jgi:hypothetical protein
MRTLGAVMLNHYIRKLRHLEEVEQQPFSWVITSVDSIKIVSDGMLLEGTVEPFKENQRLVLKPLS